MGSKKSIDKYFSSVIAAVGLLYEKQFYGQMLILIYSAIDSMGLLDAELTQTNASGVTFQKWVKKYILPHTGIEFSEVDFWGARCGVLHTFTAESGLSKQGKARQIQYYSGPKDSQKALAFVKNARSFENGKHVPARIEDVLEAFLGAMKIFPDHLLNNCTENSAYETRLNKVLQQYSL